eukprot:3448719-Pyramimonas_sp.AAC.1
MYAPKAENVYTKTVTTCTLRKLKTSTQKRAAQVPHSGPSSRKRRAGLPGGCPIWGDRRILQRPLDRTDMARRQPPGGHGGPSRGVGLRPGGPMGACAPVRGKRL